MLYRMQCRSDQTIKEWELRNLQCESLVLGLTELRGFTAESLGKYTGALNLNGLTVLSDEAARDLGNHTGNLSLNGLTALSDEAARGLDDGCFLPQCPRGATRRREIH